MAKIEKDRFVIGIMSANPAEDLFETHSELVNLLLSESDDMHVKRPHVYRLLQGLLPECKKCQRD